MAMLRLDPELPKLLLPTGSSKFPETTHHERDVSLAKPDAYTISLRPFKTNGTKPSRSSAEARLNRGV